jgi:hypothetical protein
MGKRVATGDCVKIGAVPGEVAAGGRVGRRTERISTGT